MPIIPVPRRVRKEDHKLQVSLGLLGNSVSKPKPKPK
jgi:hypothetical protein